MTYFLPDKSKPLYAPGECIPGLSSIGLYEIERVVCDACADAGEVEFEPDKWDQPTPKGAWCWRPRWGAPCDVCGRPC